MMRHTTRGLLMLGLLALAVSTARAQDILDAVEVRNRKDGLIKTYTGQLKVTPAGYQVFSGPKLEKASEPFSPDDVVKITIGDLPGAEFGALKVVRDKEAKKTAKDFAEAVTGYKELIKKAAADKNATDRTRRYLEFRLVSAGQKTVDELDPGEEWTKGADKAISDWKDFVEKHNTKEKFGWEVWPAVRALTRVQMERGRFDDASQTWSRTKVIAELPAELKLDAALQEIDSQIRSKAYPNAAGTAAELLKTATGARKERLAIYAVAAKAGSDGKHLDGVKGIEAEMAKAKDPAVHTTGYGMMGELYLAGGKPRDAMWMFLWVETVTNQDRDEVFKAVLRLTELFEAQMDEEQSKKYREKLKRARVTF